MNHTDRSHSYFKDYTQNPPKDINYNAYNKETQRDSSGRNIGNEEFRNEQLEGRIKDIETIKIYLESAQEEFKHIDMEKLSIIGHSFGALTAIEACYKDKNSFKLCAVMDIYFSGRASKILNSSDYVINQPIFINRSEYFKKSPFLNDHDHEACNNKFFEDTCKHNKKKNYNVELTATGHCGQLDVSMLMPGAMSAIKMVGPQDQVCDKLMENHGSILAFMSEN